MKVPKPTICEEKNDGATKTSGGNYAHPPAPRLFPSSWAAPAPRIIIGQQRLPNLTAGKTTQGERATDANITKREKEKHGKRAPHVFFFWFPARHHLQLHNQQPFSQRQAANTCSLDRTSPPPPKGTVLSIFPSFPAKQGESRSKRQIFPIVIRNIYAQNSPTLPDPTLFFSVHFFQHCKITTPNLRETTV